MSNQYVGEIRPFGFTFAPRDWAFCDGALQSIANNSTLFAVIGTTYGGDGQTTFGLPDMRGRAGRADRNCSCRCRHRWCRARRTARCWSGSP
jgi:microcystin-dependent protein